MKAVPLKELLTEPVKNGYSPVCVDEPTGKWVLGLGALDGNGINPKEIKPVPINNTKTDPYTLCSGDFLVSRSNTVDKVGRAALFRGEIENCAYPDLMMRFRVNENKVHPDFLDEYLRSEIAQKHFRRCAAGTSGSMVKITKSTVEKLLINLPSLVQQQAIAEIARGTNAAIEKTEALIRAKQKQFSWLSAKLINNQNGSWATSHLGKITKIKKGQQLNRDTLDDSVGYPVWNGGITTSGYTDKYNTAADTVTISEGGNSCGFVNLCNEEFWCGGHCYALEKPSDKIATEFLYYYLKSKQHQIMRLRVGSGLPNIQRRDLEKVQVSFPPLPEQQRIAYTLNTARCEIRLLQQLVKKHRTQKRGLMQKLLTGEWRIGALTQQSRQQHE
jgi:type I restriction enzyme S subunit